MRRTYFQAADTVQFATIKCPEGKKLRIVAVMGSCSLGAADECQLVLQRSTNNDLIRVLADCPVITIGEVTFGLGLSATSSVGTSVAALPNVWFEHDILINYGMLNETGALLRVYYELEPIV